jgi:hypothetical protein
MSLRPFLAVAVLLVTAGCAVPAPGLPSGGPTSVVSVSPPVASPSTPTASPPPAAPKVPDTVGGLDVSAYDVSMFASPSGAIWCAIQKDTAWCHFPSDFKGKIPSSSKVCPEEMLDVTGVSVGTKVEYFCSGDPTAFPDKTNAGSGLDWFAGTGFPWVKKDGFTLATLPYGKKLVAGSFVCLSENTGVTCGNSATGVGFKMAKAGVTILS